MSDIDIHSDAEDLDETSNEEEDEDLDEDLDDPDYKNWIRAAKGLEYLQQGLHPFVSAEITNSVTTFIKGLLTTPGQNNCNQCNQANLLAEHPAGKCISKDKSKCYCNIQRNKNRRRICPNGICSKLYHFIVQEHRTNDPLWQNSVIEKWCSDVWYVAKCFMTSNTNTSISAESTDAAGLLSIIINARFFQQKITCRIDPGKDDFSKARNARNEILHKAEMKLSEQDLFYYIDLFVAVLHDHKTLLNHKDAQDAVKKLLKLKDNQIHISIEESKNILMAREEALTALKRIEEAKEKAIEDVRAEKLETIQSIEDKKAEVLDEIEEFKTDVITSSEMKQKVLETEENVSNITDRLKEVEKYIENILKQEHKRYISRSHSNDENQDKASGATIDQYYGNAEIKTDEDTIVNVEDTDVTLRNYQTELAEEGVKGTNVVIMAPTNSGKTRVACKIMQEHLRKRKDGKVVFLVENENLAYQQGKVFSKILPAYRTKVFSGSVQRDKKMYLKDFIHLRDILVVTAQVLLNALKTKEIDSLMRFSLLVFDECHHARDLHPYNEIMGQYMDLKFNNVSPLPQVVGLTASLGAGGKSDPQAAMDHMETLLTNLDVGFLYIVAAEGRVNDLYKKAVLENMSAIDEYMNSHKSLLELPSSSDIRKKSRIPQTAGDVSFQNWLSDFKKALCDVESKRVRRMMFPCWEHLEIYNRSLIVHADARIKDARAVLKDFMEEHQHKVDNTEDNETDKMLLKLYENLKAKSFDDEPENPKLLKLGELIISILGNDDHAKGIVFVRTRDLAKAISNWMNETDNLKRFNAKECVGQSASADKGGMPRSMQKKVLDDFRGDYHKLIIATSIVEEGLDISMCNLVIRYEHVTNEIVRLQSRGRARAANSKYYVLTEVGSWIVAKEEKNKMIEDLMNEIVPILQHKIEDDPITWQQRLTERQKLTKLLEEERQERERMAKMAHGVKALHCFKCSKFICLSSDIRRIKGTQHVVIDENVQKRISWTRKPLPKFKNDELKFDGTTFCGNSSCKQKLGGVCEYKGIEFPLISICNFFVVDENDKRRTFKKWKDVNFNVEDYSLEQFQEIVEERK